ncbi:MAG: hypothetical protein AAF950_13660, partial [Pseudomonadota bacterium]
AVKPVAKRSFDPVDQMKVKQAPAGALKSRTGRQAPVRKKVLPAMSICHPGTPGAEGQPGYPGPRKFYALCIRYCRGHLR